AVSGAPTRRQALPRRPAPARDDFPRGIALPLRRTERCLFSNEWFIRLAVPAALRQPKKTDARLGETHGRSHSGMVRKDQTRNLEILRCAIAHHSSMLAHRPGMTGSLSRPDIAQEGVDFRTQPIGFAAKRLRRVQHLGRRRAGLGGSGGDPDDVAGNLGCAAGSVLDVAGDLACGRALLFDRSRDRGGHLVDLAYGLTNVPDGAD